MRSNTVACAILVIVVMTASFADEPHNHSDSGHNCWQRYVPISCSKKARDHIERGLAMFHSFLFDDAELQFATAANVDAGCAMAFWAEAIKLYRPLAYLPAADDMKRGLEMIQMRVYSVPEHSANDHPLEHAEKAITI